MHVPICTTVHFLWFAIQSHVPAVFVVIRVHHLSCMVRVSVEVNACTCTIWLQIPGIHDKIGVKLEPHMPYLPTEEVHGTPIANAHRM